MAFHLVLKSDKEIEQFKTWTMGVLRDDKIRDLCITFTKKDGTERAMRCTLVEGRIPEDKKPAQRAGDTDSASTGSAVRVFDEEKSEWRSFRWDSVIEVVYTL